MKFIIFIYSIFLFVFVAFSYLFIDPNLSYFRNFYSEFIFQHRLITAVLYALFILLFFVFYLYFLKLKKDNGLSYKNVKILVGLSVGILFFSYPAILSFDIFNYIFTAKVLYFYHENPYIIMPIHFVGDPLLDFTHAANKIALYGPSWIGITFVPFILGLGNFLVTLFNFKLVGVFLYLLTIRVLYLFKKDYSSVVIFALNPLVLIETLVSGHNDIVMMFFALSAFLFLEKKKNLRAFLFLLISLLIKYSTLILIPMFLYCLYKDYKKQKINWNAIYIISALLMLCVFLLSPIREEIYPWYAIWFLSFLPLLPKNKSVNVLAIVFSFSLLLRYVPFMLLGTYDFPTPLIKEAVTFIPVFIAFVYIFVKNKLWSKKLHLF